MAPEIERKFRLDDLPGYLLNQKVTIRQGYLPATDIIQHRHDGAILFVTKKGNGSVWKSAIPSWVEEALREDRRPGKRREAKEKLRLRQKGKKYSLTVKDSGNLDLQETVTNGKALTRQEWEISIPQWVFDQLWPMTGDHNISKTRYPFPFKGMEYELDVFDDPKTPGLIILEIEFVSEDQAIAFNLPSELDQFVSKEVTDDPDYQNKNLALHGLPEIKNL